MILREKDKQALIDIFASTTIPIEIWAYGSRVNGSAHEASDLDLVLRTQTLQSISIEEYAKLTEKLTESNIPILVELRDWAKLPKSFHTQIEQRYEVLFSNF